MCAGALVAAGVEQSAIVGICLGMSGVDRDADASTLKASLQKWLSQEARALDSATVVHKLFCEIPIWGQTPSQRGPQEKLPLGLLCKGEKYVR